MSSIAQTALSITDIIGRVASFGQQALPVAEFIADLIPGGGVIVDAVKIAAPIIAKIAQYEPQVAAAIQAGTPILDAIQAHGGDVLGSFKALYAVAVNHDPMRPETHMTAADVTNDQAHAFAGRVGFGSWTNAEYQQWWDRAVGSA